MKKQPTVNTPDGVLVRLKNKLCLFLGVDQYRLRIMIDRFVLKSTGGSTASKLHYDKINTYNEISAFRMTIKVFIKFLTILEVKKAIITVDIVNGEGKEVSTSVDLLCIKPEKIFVALKEGLTLALGLDRKGINKLAAKFMFGTVAQEEPGTEANADYKLFSMRDINTDKMTIKDFFKFLKLIDVVSAKLTVKVVTSRDIEVEASEEIRFLSSSVEEDKNNE